MRPFVRWLTPAPLHGTVASSGWNLLAAGGWPIAVTSAFDAVVVAIPMEWAAVLLEPVAPALGAQPAAVLARMFAVIDVVNMAGAAMGAVGLDPQNTSDVYVVWWIEAWASTSPP